MPTPGPWNRVPTKEALNIVRKILSEQPAPMKVHDLYKLALQKPCKPPGDAAVIQTAHGPIIPPYDHAVRSMRFVFKGQILLFIILISDPSYLKRSILPCLVRRGEAEQIHTTVTLSAEELQQRLQNMNKAQRKSASQKSEQMIFAWRLKSPRTPPEPKPEPIVFGGEVGVGHDWSHLNKRRQRSRREGVARDVAWLKELGTARSTASAGARQA